MLNYSRFGGTIMNQNSIGNNKNYLEGFENTVVGSVPQIKSALETKDILGTVMARIGIGRDRYSVIPGLYCVGTPNSDSPVMVTANYKLSFDHLRRELAGLNAWIVVVDTCGINVWCAAGKKTFSTDEVIRRVNQTRLKEIVSHRELILPQLSATGVIGRKIRKACGFKVIWGPVRAGDIRKFIRSEFKADNAMRSVSFTFLERLVLVPVELSSLRKYLLWIFLMGFVLSGIDANVFSFGLAWRRGLVLVTGCAAGIFAGAVAAPLLLPWLPTRAFAVKGLFTGLAMGIGVIILMGNRVSFAETGALVLLIVSISSYLAMNFTGSTPYTSPSGVEKEMRMAIPIQTLALILSISVWIGSAFIQR